MPHTTPIVFVVDDDVSVRESLELMIRWQAGSRRYSRPHGSSCLTREFLLRAAWFLTSIFRTSMVSIFKSASLAIGLTCPSFSSRATATCQ